MGEQAYAFGRNWQRYVSRHLTPQREQQAQMSVIDLVGDVTGKAFLDVGCGSGLFSLAAHRLGASVVSLDVDPQSVAATRYLREREGSPDRWEVLEESILDHPPLEPADVVYSWGVLHHTGAMWEAIRNTAALVKPGGLLAISIYNTGHNRLLTVDRWRKIKRTYSRAPRPIKWAMKVLYLGYAAQSTLRSGEKLFERGRGMAFWTDVDDWLGGYPYETATAEELIAFIEPLGFEAIVVRPDDGFSTNEIAFRRL